MELLVTYDIATHDRAGERRLHRVAKICESYGLRVQYSVFECRLSGAAHQHLIGELTAAIDPRYDSVHLYQFHGKLQQARQTLGQPPLTTVADPWLV